ncbi:hypothetical protein CTI14_37335 [Methylobacterium radiotolerans]|nr:hypothetical protein CTI14_37335 [Methylobacterium radiotolerans]
MAALDAETGAVPTYLINADVHSVWLNSAALAREGFRGDDGLLREEDAFEISRRLNAVDPAHSDEAVIRAGAAAAARGVTGLVDFDMAWNADAWPRRILAGSPRTASSSRSIRRISIGRSPRVSARGERLAVSDPTGLVGSLVRVGSLKVISDGSLGTRTAACSHSYPGAPRTTGC